jgi:enoyl-CoA hydratase/carnithine racemase
MPLFTLKYEKKGAVGCITINRTQAGNAITPQMQHELAAVCDEIAHDDETRVLIITGDGSVFCTGAERGDDADLNEARRPNLRDQGLRSIADLGMPVIAAINGDALDEGLELALCCDLRLAEDGVRLGLTSAAKGGLPTLGGGQRLARLVGRGAALDMLLKAQPIDAQESHRIGLINRIVPKGQALSAAEELASTIATKAPLALQAIKEAVIKGLDLTLDQGMRLEADLSFLLFTTEDRAEGLAAFAEKRTPEFKGR